MTLDVRLTLRTHDGALISMSYGGRWVVPADVRDAVADPGAGTRSTPAGYYFRTNPLFETGYAGLRLAQRRRGRRLRLPRRRRDRLPGVPGRLTAPMRSSALGTGAAAGQSP